MTTATQNPAPVQSTESGSAPAVVLDSVTKVYGSKTTAVAALREVSLSVQPAEFLAVMGPSGSGKTTLLHCAAGLDKINRGRIYLLGRQLAGFSDSQLSKFRRYNCGFVFQSYNLIPTLTAADNICLPDVIAGRPRSNQQLEALAKALGLQDRLKHRPGELSGGQQQRVAVARALIHKPRIIFADEPTGNLDSKTANDLIKFLKLIGSKQSQAIMMVTHEPAIAAYADRVVFLRDGQLVDEMVKPKTSAIYQKLQNLDR